MDFLSNYTAPADYIGFIRMSLSFTPTNGSVVCTPITIVSDTTPEGTESFNFIIDASQSDRAVVVGAMNSASIQILDDANGTP